MKLETPILKRLGPIPFWRGSERCLDTLESIYQRAAEKAEGVLAHEAGKANQRKRAKRN